MIAPRLFQQSFVRHSFSTGNSRQRPCPVGR